MDLKLVFLIVFFIGAFFFFTPFLFKNMRKLIAYYAFCSCALAFAGFWFYQDYITSGTYSYISPFVLGAMWIPLSTASLVNSIAIKLRHKKET